MSKITLKKSAFCYNVIDFYQWASYNEVNLSKQKGSYSFNRAPKGTYTIVYIGANPNIQINDYLIKDKNDIYYLVPSYDITE